MRRVLCAGGGNATAGSAKDGYFRSIWAIKTPAAANNRPPISRGVSRSPRNAQAGTAIWMSIVLLIILDSTADKTRRERFQRVNAKAVLTRASQMTMIHPDGLISGTLVTQGGDVIVALTAAGVEFILNRDQLSSL